MSLKDILVFLDVSPASEGRLRLATRVARDHGASLSAVFAYDDQATDLPPGLGVPRRGLMTQLSPPRPTSRGAHRLSTLPSDGFGNLVQSLGGEGDWHQLDRANETELIALARTADLIVIGQINPNTRARADVATGRRCRRLWPTSADGSVYRHFYGSRTSCSRCLGRVARGSARSQRCATGDRRRGRGDSDDRARARQGFRA